MVLAIAVCVCVSFESQRGIYILRTVCFIRISPAMCSGAQASACVHLLRGN